jgi:SagB-type dehydrogenase family enzyme
MTRLLRLLLTLLIAGLAIGPACRETSTQPARPRVIALPGPTLDGGMSLEAAIAARRSVREYADQRLIWKEIGQLAWAAQGITDPGGRFRAAPSAGALYPMELYFVAADGLYHYLPEGHKMEQLGSDDLRAKLQAAALNQESVGAAPVTIVIAGVQERTAAKYGDRAERYVFIEAGHVGQNIALQAVALGLGCVTIGAFHDDQVAELLSLPEDHRVLYILPVGHPRPA